MRIVDMMSEMRQYNVIDTLHNGEYRINITSFSSKINPFIVYNFVNDLFNNNSLCIEDLLYEIKNMNKSIIDVTFREFDTVTKTFININRHITKCNRSIGWTKNPIVDIKYSHHGAFDTLDLTLSSPVYFIKGENKND